MLSHIRTMAHYNRWMNRKLYDVCGDLPDDQRKRGMGAFFGSIHGTLNHLLLTDRLWMGRFTGESFRARSLDQELYSDFAILRAQRRIEDEGIIVWVEALRSEDLERELTYESMVGGRLRRCPLWCALTHFFNHQTHHRGQVTTLLSQQGVDPGVTDLLMMPDRPA